VLGAPGNALSSPSFIDKRYVGGDVNLDGAAIFQGQNNDADWIYNSVILDPLNTGNESAFTLHLDQVPAAVPGPDLSAQCTVSVTIDSPPKVLAETGSSSGLWVGLVALGAAALGALFAARARSERA